MNQSKINTILNVIILTVGIIGIKLAIYYNEPIRDNSLNNLCKEGIYVGEQCDRFIRRK